MKLVEIIFGTIEVQIILGQLFFLVAGLLMSIFKRALVRDPNSENSPVEFSLKFLIKTNWVKFTLGLTLGMVILRFSSDLFQLESTPFTAFLIGFFNDQFVDKLKNFNKKHDS